jgi:hypothetical protein
MTFRDRVDREAKTLRAFARSPSPGVIAKLDVDSIDAYRRIRNTVMLATRFASASIRRKASFVPALYLDALADASVLEERETRWRAFIAATASLNRDLESGRAIVNDANRRARDELIRIVEENADLLDDRYRHVCGSSLNSRE